MSGQLFLRVPGPGGSDAQWLERAEDGAVLASGSLRWPDELSRLRGDEQGAPRAVTLLLPVAQVLVSSVQVPAKQARHLDRVLPFLIEDQLAGNVDDLHVVAGAALGDERRQVLAVDNAWLTAQLNLLAGAGFDVRHCTVDALCLPVSAGGAAVLFESGQVLLRLADGSAQCLHPDDWPLLAPALLDGLSAEFWRSDATQTIAGIDTPHDLAAATHEIDAPLALLTAQAAQAPGLLTGRHARRSDWQQQWQPWRAVAALLLLALLAQYGLWIADYFQTASRERQLRDSMRAQFQAALPDDTRGQDPAARLRALTRDGAAAGGPGFLALLAQLTPILQAQSGVHLRGLGFEAARSELRLDLEAADLGALNQLQSALQGAGLHTDMGQASGGERGYTGRMVVKAGPTGAGKNP